LIALRYLSAIPGNPAPGEVAQPLERHPGSNSAAVDTHPVIPPIMALLLAVGRIDSYEARSKQSFLYDEH